VGPLKLPPVRRKDRRKRKNWRKTEERKKELEGGEVRSEKKR